MEEAVLDGTVWSSIVSVRDMIAQRQPREVKAGFNVIRPRLHLG